MIQEMFQALTPLKYLRIEIARKGTFDYILPLVLGLILAFVASWPGVGLRVFGETGLLDKTCDLFGVLVGFFITALAAVATFENKALNQTLKSSAVLHDDGETHELTRRSFLCYLFGYLALVSLIVFLVGAFAGASDAGMRKLLSYGWWVRPAFILPYCLAISHIFSVTSLGLYYLVERIHRPDPEFGSVQYDGGDGSADN